MLITAYLHSSKDGLYEAGQEFGLKGQALYNYAHMLYEVEFELELDITTGETEILKVDGMKLISCEELDRLERIANKALKM